MWKKIVVLGLGLLLGGTALLGWVFTEQRREGRQQQERRERFKATLSKVDAVIGDEIDVSHLDGIVYEEDSRPNPDQCKKREERREFVVTIAGVFTLTGGTILSWCLLFWTSRSLVRGFSSLAKSSSGLLRGQIETNDKQVARSGARGNEKDSEGPQARKRVSENARQKSCERHGGAAGQVERHSKVLVDSGWQSFSKDNPSWRESAVSQTAVQTKSKASGQDRDDKSRERGFGSFSTKGAIKGAKGNTRAYGTAKTGELLSDEESVRLEEPLKVKTKGLKFKTRLPNFAESSLRPDDSFKMQSESLEKQMVEFKQMAQSVQQSALEHSKPMEASLKELTQQVSAIREYAAGQQERVEKLQDGYDWNIIKNFCLRVIRCIDNLESRISKLSKRKANTTDLEEVRDELVFALESTGVERFEPEINSDYHGQEKSTEAVKDKEKCDDPKLAGKIAKVVRRGYQYFVDEENVRIVRPAQVKLYS